MPLSPEEKPMPPIEQDKSRVPIVKINKKLNKLAKENLFPDKVEMANRMLAGVELPKARKPLKRSKSPKDIRTAARVRA